MTTADSMALAVLIAARDGDTRPLSRKWRAIYERFQRDGLLRITSRERVFKLAEDGRSELARLQAMGVEPAAWVEVRGKAHDGAETGFKGGREMRAARRAA